MKVNEPRGFVVDKADVLISDDADWWLQEIGLDVDENPCMSPGSKVADATDLRAIGDNVDYLI